jgi:glycosyltransferase involved in cell wall biosynthesis
MRKYGEIELQTILHIVGDSEYGGGSKVIESLVSASLSKGYRVYVLTTDPVFQKQVSGLGAGVIDLDCIWRPIRPIKDLYGLIKLFLFLRSNKFDIVHTHTSKAGMIGRIASKLAGVNSIVHTIHGFAFSEVSSQAKILFYSSLERISAFFCDKIITVSNYHRSWALTLGIANERKLVSIPNAVSPISNVLYKASNSKEFRISFVGRIVKEKGLFDLVEAIQLLNKDYKVFLDLVGTGEDEIELKKYSISAGIEDRVIFHGFQKSVATFLLRSDVFCLPSYREGFSISILEAMSIGMPIVATKVGGNSEALGGGKAGIICNARDSEELACAIGKLIGAIDKRAELGREAYNRYSSLYTEDCMTQEYLRLYETL